MNTKDYLYPKVAEIKRKIKETLNGGLSRKANIVAKSPSMREHFKDYYLKKVNFQEQHLVYVLEEKKAFIKWFFTEYPQFNIAYDPKTTEKDFKITVRDGSFWVKTKQLARERDLLFGTNGVKAVKIDNWKQRLDEACENDDETTINDIKHLFISRWKVDDFVQNVKKLVDAMVDDMRWLKYEVDKPTQKWNLFRDWGKKFTGFSEMQFYLDVMRVGKYVYNQKFQELFAQQTSPIAWGSAAHGSQNAEVQLHQRAGMQFAYYVAYDLMKNELDKNIEVARQRVLTASIFNEDKQNKIKYVGKAFPKGDGAKPELVSWTPSVASIPQEKSNSSPASSNSSPISSDTNSDSGYDSDYGPEMDKDSEAVNFDNLSKEEAETKLAEVESESQEVEKQITNFDKSAPDKDKKKKELETLINKLKAQQKEAKGNPDFSEDRVAELEDKINNLEDKLKEVTAVLLSLQEWFTNNSSGLEQLKQYFTKNSVKSIRLNGDNWIIDYDSKSQATVAATDAPELQEIKKYLQSSNRNAMMREEILNTSTSSSNQSSSPDDSKKKLLIIGVAAVSVLALGAIGLWWWKKSKKKSN